MQNFVILDKLGDPIQIPIRRSTKAKRIAIKASHKGVELVLPNTNIQDGYSFLLQKESWVRKQLRRSFEQTPICRKTLPILDTTYSMEYISSSKHEVRVEDGLLQIYSLPIKQNEVLIKFLYKTLLLEVSKLAISLSEAHGICFTKIKITNNKSKWGSCSSKGVLSFNWRLIFAPAYILEYVVIHEICHIREMNHSKKFWGLVERMCPNYKSAKLWLKENRNRLHQYLE